MNNHSAYIEALKAANQILIEINKIADLLPYDNIFNISKDIRFLTHVITNNIDRAYLGDDPVERFYCKVRIIEAMSECKECLDLVKRLKYYNTKETLDKINFMDQLLKAA